MTSAEAGNKLPELDLKVCVVSVDANATVANKGRIVSTGSEGVGAVNNEKKNERGLNKDLD